MKSSLEIMCNVLSVRYENEKLIASMRVGSRHNDVVLISVGEHDGIMYTEECLKQAAEDMNKTLKE